MTDSAVKYERGEDGIVVLTLDDPTSSANTMNDLYRDSMHAAVERSYAEKDDVDRRRDRLGQEDLLRRRQPQGDAGRRRPADARRRSSRWVEAIKADLRRLEKLPASPVVAAINGAALGGGLEIALACHHRIVVDDATVDLGLPEATLGLLPGGGGVTRIVRMFGIQTALMDFLLQGTRFKPAAATEKGLVDELVATREELLPAAKAWILGQGRPGRGQQPVGPRRATRSPAARRKSPALAAFLPAFPAMLRKQTKGAVYPAQRAIMSAAIEGAQVDFDTASRIESRYLAELITGSNSKNMIQAFFFDLSADQRAARCAPRASRRSPPTKVGVLGAGMMGAGIAYSCARAGMRSCSRTSSRPRPTRARPTARRSWPRPSSAAGWTRPRRPRSSTGSPPPTDPADFAGCDLVIEAVFEDPGLKARSSARSRTSSTPTPCCARTPPRCRSPSWPQGVNRPERLHRPALLLPGRQDAAGRDHQGRARPPTTSVAQALDVVTADPQDPDRGQRQPRLLHQPGHRHDGQRGPRDARRGRPPDVGGAGGHAGRLPGRHAAALRRAQHGADGQDRQGHAPRPPARRTSSTRATAVVRHDDRGRPPRPLRGAGFYDYDENGRRGALWSGLAGALPRRTTSPPTSTTSRTATCSSRRSRPPSASRRA